MRREKGEKGDEKSEKGEERDEKVREGKREKRENFLRENGEGRRLIRGRLKVKRWEGEGLEGEGEERGRMNIRQCRIYIYSRKIKDTRYKMYGFIDSKYAE